jgi:hypothetical protein
MRASIAYALPVLTTCVLVILLATPEYEDMTRELLRDRHFRPWWEIGGFMALSNAVGLAGLHGIAEGSRAETAGGAILVAFLIPYWPFESIWSLVVGVPLLLGVMLVGSGK